MTVLHDIEIYNDFTSFFKQTRSKGLRKTLFHSTKNKRCVYCNNKLSLKTEVPEHRATVEHIYSKHDIRRFLFLSYREKTVLSCLKCNQDRDQSEKKKIGNQFRNLRQLAIHEGMLIILLKNASA